MVRTACVSIPFLSLQLLLRMHQEWREHPAAVVTEDKPTGGILEINAKARKLGVRPGMRYSAAVALAPTLRAATVEPQIVHRGSREIVTILSSFSPSVEPWPLDPGVFWVDARGFTRLYGSAQAWGASLRTGIEKAGFSCRCAVGFSRFGAFAGARQARPFTVFDSPTEEKQQALEASLTTLPLDARTSRHLAHLGVETIRAFVHLPSAAVRLRFGSRAGDLHTFAEGTRPLPLQPVPPVESTTLSRNIQSEITETHRLLGHIEQLLCRVLDHLRLHGEILTSLRFTLSMEGGETVAEEIHPAEPTVDPSLLRSLVDLRLQTVDIHDGVTGVTVSYDRVSCRSIQDELFSDPTVEQPRRDPKAANHALALIRSELGNNAVRIAVLTNEHLPENRYAWRTFERVSSTPARPSSDCLHSRRHLVRRVYEQPLEIGREHDPRGLRDCGGPFRLSGGWWEEETRREYRFSQSPTGRILWLYRDIRNNRWMSQGYIE